MGRKAARNMWSRNTNKTGIKCICWFYSEGICYDTWSYERNMTHLVVHQLASSDRLCLRRGIQTYENRVLSTLTRLNFAPSVPFITDTASVNEQLILAKAVCLHLPKCPDLNGCIAVDWVQLLSYGQICLNKHGVLPTQQVWKNEAIKTSTHL